jgi:hypothetical protein
MATIEAQLADDIEWNQMPYNQKVRRKKDVMAWLKTGSSDKKEPEIFNDVMANDWVVFEYWNVGTVSQELIVFGKAHGWQFPESPGEPCRTDVQSCAVLRLPPEYRRQDRFDEAILGRR